MADEGQLSEKELAAWRSFVTMHHRLERHLAGQLQRECGLSGSDFEVLVNLSEAPDGRMRAFELGQATQWEKSRLSHHLSRMEKRGLVRREVAAGSNARYPGRRADSRGPRRDRVIGSPQRSPCSETLHRRVGAAAAGHAAQGFRRRSRGHRKCHIVAMTVQIRP